MVRDAFSKRHPLVNVLFFLGAFGFGMMIQHPAYVAASLICSGGYYLLLKGRRGIRRFLGLIPMFLLLTLINPLFNTYGTTALFLVAGRPYTWEALVYGAVIAGMLVAMLLWFGCCNLVLTSDKFTSLFGNYIPVLSLLLVMVLRMIPNLMRKASQIGGARMAIGKGISEHEKKRDKLLEGMVILGALASWALEGGIVTGDSMGSRGYGTAKRTSFQVYRLTGKESVLLIVQLLLAIIVIITAAKGGTKATFTPEYYTAPLTGSSLGGFLAYCSYLLIPVGLHIKETLIWYISRSKI